MHQELAAGTLKAPLAPGTALLKGSSGRFTSRRRAPAPSRAVASAARSSVHQLPDGVKLEVLRADARESNGQQPLLFLHGSGHGAWCWNSNFMPYFAERGRSSVAISFRGQGESSVPKDAQPGTLESNAADIADFLATLPQPPIAVSHSFGGLVLQKYLELADDQQWPKLAGAAFLASAPPSGNQALVKRIMARMPLRSIRITWGFITKSYQRSADAAKDMFFSEDIPEDALQRSADAFKRYPGSTGLVDLKNLSNELPIKLQPERLPPTFVGGGDTDVIVDVPAVEELADVLDVSPVVWSDMAHDVMLDTRWLTVAADLDKWLKTVS